MRIYATKRFIYNILRTLKKYFYPKSKGKNNHIINESLFYPKIYIHGNNNIIEIRNGVHLYNVQIKIFGNNHRLIIEQNCTIKNSTIWFEDKNNDITIGASTTIEGCHIACVGNLHTIKIEKKCMLSSGVYIANTDSHSIIDKDNKRINPEGDIKINAHFWIGMDVTILKGTEIGENCIIGAKSLVTSKIYQSNSIIAGIPAKVIKENINWCRERI